MKRRKPQGIKRVKNSSSKFPKWVKLDQKAFSGPINGPSFSFTVTKLGKFHLPVFRSKFAAKKYLNLLIRDDKVVWQSDTELITEPTGLKIRGTHLKELMEYEFRSSRAKVWDLPEIYNRYSEYLRNDSEYDPPPEKKYKSRISRKGMILIKDICDQLDMHPRDARGILRALRFKKPKHGWAWKTREEADEIKKTLQQSRRKTHDPELDD